MPEPQPAPEADKPLRDPYPSQPPPPRSSGRALWVLSFVIVVAIGGLAAVGLGVRSWLAPPPQSVITVRPTATLLIAVRDLARLETAEVHVEKVIDLADRQSRLYGLIEGSDAILLVAVGHATLGVDLSKLGEADVSMDPDGKTARLRLPAPELLGAALDENATYVYSRSTSLLARRNEQLEGQARREAVEAIKKAAQAPDMTARAKAQAERQLRALVSRLGASQVEITWRD